MQQLEVSTNPIGSPNPQAIEGISLPEFLAIMRRRRMVVLQAFVLITVVAVAWTLMTKPVYQASARLIVESPSTALNTVDTSNPLSAILALTPPQSVDTQVQALQSPPLLAKARQQAGAADMVVKAIGTTNVIEVTSESHSPQSAANAPNTLLRLYIDQDLDQNLNEIKDAETFARQQEQATQQRLSRAQVQLELFKQRHHVAQLDTDRDKQVAQVATLTDALQAAQTTLAALQSQAAETRRQLGGQAATLQSDVQATNPATATLQDKLADLRLQREGLTQSGGFTPKAPPVQALDAQIAQVQQRLAAQPPLAVTRTISPNARRAALQEKLQDLQAQEAAQQAQVAATGRDLAQAKDQVGHFADWEVTLDNLNRELAQATALDTMLTDKLSDLGLREKAHHATARIDEVAQVPTVPIRPKKAYNIILGMMFGLFIGVCMALLQEFLDDRINTVEDAHRVLGLPSLGMVPALTAGDARLLPLMKGMDPAAESYRLLRTNIQFASIDTPIRTLLVTSSSPGEGKTTTAANLAFAMAMDGKKVILVDTDLRRPSLHKLLGLPTVPGLTDVLLDRADLDGALLENNDLPLLATLSAGSTPPNPSELLNSRRFRNLVDEMTKMADIVIFDSPPVHVAADAAILASQMDGTVLVVEGGETKKAPAKHALTLLQKGRANMLGVMYNKMHTLEGNGYYYYQYSTPSLAEAGAIRNGAAPLPAPVETEE